MIRIKFHSKHDEQGSWQSDISGIIVKLRSRWLLLLHHKPLFSACFTIEPWWSNASLCLLLGSRDALTCLDLDERAVDMCVSTENHLKAFSRSHSCAQETSKAFRVNTSFHAAPSQYFQRTWSRPSSGVSSISQTWTFAFSSDLQRTICTYVVCGGTH